MIKYESMYILKPDMEEEKKDALVKRFSDIVEKSGGKMEKIDEGKKASCVSDPVSERRLLCTHDV